MKFLAPLLLALLAFGCAKRPVMISSPCGSHTKQEIVSTLTPLLIAEGMEIKIANESLGLLQAETRPDFSVWTGATTVFKWSISIKSPSPAVGAGSDSQGSAQPLVVQAYASSYTSTSNAFGSTTGTAETPYDDHCHPDHKWYWNVRNALEEYCGAQLVFTRDGESVAQPGK